MRLKLTILTILVGALSVLSFYLVYSDQKINLEAALASSSRSGSGFDLQTAFVLPISEPTYFPIRNTEIAPPELSAKSFLVYDTQNDKIIFSKDDGRALPVASLTKLLSAIIIFENLDPQDIIEITPESFNVDGEGADFHLQEQFYLKDLLGALLVKSSNDAAAAIALKVERKTGQKFIDLMNQKALQIGLERSNFLDPAGLNDEGYSTARDLLRLIRYFKGYPELWRLLGLGSLDIFSADRKFSHHFTSTNKLFGVLPNLTGGKTGYTDGALGCMILEENLPEQSSSLIVIVLGSNDRFGEIQKLVNWSKLAFRWR
ncbi:MAG: D-alanyl-D-alanine carboxypeptidase [Parcubacteria group bacterium Gr01-1014_44]|nr:MAG: D-alanyl-D-alanine carboxypeptidase [Parcubacteria group bacterium Gr01-1014_44]